MTKKKIKDHENQKCECGHVKIYHQGINGACYHPKCKCINFRLKSKKENNESPHKS